VPARGPARADPAHAPPGGGGSRVRPRLRAGPSACGPAAHHAEHPMGFGGCNGAVVLEAA
jgi:hypothetical protein